MASTKKKGVKIPRRPLTREEFTALSQKVSDLVQQKRAAAQLTAESLAAGRAGFTEADGSREERIERTRESALEFGRVYLPHFFEQPSAPFHAALDALLTGNYTDDDLRRWAQEFGIDIHIGDPVLRLLAIEIFRGGGKSVLAILCDCLRRICHGLDPYIILASDTLDQAASQLEDIKDELATNEKIKADFGELKPSADSDWVAIGLEQDEAGRAVWREGRIVTANNIRMDAIGRGSKMRGRRHGAKRPSHFIGDDLDNDENVVTVEQRNKAWNWLISAVVPALDPICGRVVVIGTCIHFDCVIARAERKADADGQRLFTSIKFAALRRNAEGEWESVWPERFSTEVLLKTKELLGPTKFGAEYQNDPRDPASRIFNPDDFYFYKHSEIDGAKGMIRVLYVDPSKGKKGKGRKKSDFSGFADVLADRVAKISYVLDAFRKRLTPAQAKYEVASWYERVLKTDRSAELWIEENSFGDVLGDTFQDELRKRGVNRPVKTLLHTTEKEARLGHHSIRVETKSVRFPEKWEREDKRPEFFSEYEDFPAAAFDDTIDAIESADTIAMELYAGMPEVRGSGQKLESASMAGY